MEHSSKTESPAAVASSQWSLVGAINPGAAPAQITVHSAKFQIGRRSDLHLCIPRGSVSKVHAELVNADSMLFVRDLHSTNGTYVNGLRIESDTPLGNGDILQFADAEFRVVCTEQAQVDCTIASSPSEWQWAVSSINNLISERQLIPFYQPIVDIQTGATLGYEVLVRSAIERLRSPYDMFQAAALLGVETRLSVLSREMGLLDAEKLSSPSMLFLNTHPAEHDGKGLIASLENLLSIRSDLPLVLELHEAAITDLGQMRELRSELSRLGIGLAFDDFGAGQSRLVELAEIAPDYLKFDIGLIRDIQHSPPRQQLISSILGISHDLGIKCLAEGIEQTEEAAVCRDLGFSLAQGYFYARPDRLEKFLSR